MRNHIYPETRILAYCLRPNHFHWLLYVRKKYPNQLTSKKLNKQIGTLLSSYAQALNKQLGRTGSLFQQKIKAVGIEHREYALTCFHYIHQNPIRANLVTKLDQWPFSSYSNYAGFRNGSLTDQKFTQNYLNIKPDSFIEESKQAIDPQLIKKIY